MNIEEIFRKHEQYLKSLPDVTSVGIGEADGKEVLIVFIRRGDSGTLSHASAGIPKTLDDIPVIVREEVRVNR